MGNSQAYLTEASAPIVFARRHSSTPGARRVLRLRLSVLGELSCSASPASWGRYLVLTTAVRCERRYQAFGYRCPQVGAAAARCQVAPAASRSPGSSMARRLNGAAGPGRPNQVLRRQHAPQRCRVCQSPPPGLAGTNRLQGALGASSVPETVRWHGRLDGRFWGCFASGGACAAWCGWEVRGSRLGGRWGYPDLRGCNGSSIRDWVGRL